MSNVNLAGSTPSDEPGPAYSMTVHGQLGYPLAPPGRLFRIAATGGILFVVCLYVGVILGDTTILHDLPEPASDATGEQRATYLMHSQSSQLLKAYLLSLSALFLLLFVAAVREAIHRRERGSNLVSAVGFGAGVLGAGLTLAAGGLEIPLLARADRGIEPVIAQATNDLSRALFVSSWLAMAAFLGATAAAAITSGALPRWVGVGALVAAAGLVMIALAPRQPWIYNVYGLFPVWVVVASIALIRSPPRGRGS